MSSTPPSSLRSRSTTPSARYPLRRCSKAGWLPRRRTSASASNLPQRITHFKRLRDCTADLTQFIGALEPVRQAGKLGLLLFQLPPNFKADAACLTDFLTIPALHISGATPIAFEFRHESWFCDEIYTILRQHNAALCIAESDDLTTPEVHTAASHTGFRLRRNNGYSPEELAAFAKRFTALAQQRDVYVYFKHEDDPTGALNAVAFLAQAGKP